MTSKYFWSFTRVSSRLTLVRWSNNSMLFGLFILKITVFQQSPTKGFSKELGIEQFLEHLQEKKNSLTSNLCMEKSLT